MSRNVRRSQEYFSHTKAVSIVFGGPEHGRDSILFSVRKFSMVAIPTRGRVALNGVCRRSRQLHQSGASLRFDS